MPDQTPRQALVELLSTREMSISEIARTLEMKFSEIEFALQHVERSIRPRKLKITPARCQGCGFVFKDRRKFTPPSRCPECKSEWIKEALFSIG